MNHLRNVSLTHAQHALFVSLSLAIAVFIASNNIYVRNKSWQFADGKPWPEQDSLSQAKPRFSIPIPIFRPIRPPNQ